MKLAAIGAILLLMASVARPQVAKSTPGAQTRGRRLALLVGNQSYSKFRPLPAVPTELDMVREAIEAANFKVTLVKDATYSELTKAFEKFVAGVQPGDIVFFYYSGYAAGVEEDDLLIPVDFDPATGGLDSNRAYPITTLAKYIQVQQADKDEVIRPPAFKMFFLEAARKLDPAIPKVPSGLRKPSMSNDLTQVLFAIPTVSGETVKTPLNEVGLFTTALVKEINSEDPLAEVMPQVLKAVSAKDPQQQPDSDNKVTQKFYFHVPKPPPPPRSQNQKDREFYVWIPAGQFLMGCVPGVKCEKEEEPQHPVTLTKPFWMGENEVRVVSYKLFLAQDKTKSHKLPTPYKENNKWHDLENPMNNIKWEDARDYCEWVGGRLPTEAEWEYAARGGKNNQVYPFGDFEASRNKANFAGMSANDQYEYTAPVQKFDKNGYGLFDMSGNVWEMVNDYFGPYTDKAAVDPTGPKTGKARVQRGGSYDSDPKTHLRISFREPAKTWTNVGFRCVMDDGDDTRKTLGIE